jgi:hypothetical protein
MSEFTLRKAQKSKSKLRIGLSGTSGSGKTYSALLLAYGLVGDWSKVKAANSSAVAGQSHGEASFHPPASSTPGAW